MRIVFTNRSACGLQFGLCAGIGTHLTPLELSRVVQAFVYSGCRSWITMSRVAQESVHSIQQIPTDLQHQGAVWVDADACDVHNSLRERGCTLSRDEWRLWVEAEPGEHGLRCRSRLGGLLNFYH